MIMGEMMKILDVRSKDFETSFKALLARGKMDIKEVSSVVESLLDEIKQNGLEAIKALPMIEFTPFIKSKKHKVGLIVKIMAVYSV